MSSDHAAVASAAGAACAVQSAAGPSADGAELSLWRNDAALMRAFLDALSDEMVQSCAVQIAAADRSSSAGAGAAAGASSVRRSAASFHEQEAVRARTERAERARAEALILIDDEMADEEASAAAAAGTAAVPLAPLDPYPVTVASSSVAAMAAAPRAHSGVSLYHSLWSKRVCVLKRMLRRTYSEIEHAASAHHARQTLSAAPAIALPAAPAPATSSLGWTATATSSPLLRWGLLSLFPLIESVSRADPRVRDQSVRILLSVLRSAPPLSLASQEDAETIEHMRALLTPAPPTSDSMDGSKSAAPQSAEVRSALIGLALQRGSLSHILAALQPVLEGALDPASQSQPLDVSDYLRAVASHHAQVKQSSALAEEALQGSWTHHPLSLVQSHAPSRLVDVAAARAASDAAANAVTISMFAPESSGADAAAALAVAEAGATSSWMLRPLASVIPYASCIATDGRYLFVHSAAGLFKLGSGRGGSVQGHVYAANREFGGGDVFGGWLAFVAGSLYYRSNAPPTGSLKRRAGHYLATKIDPESLAVMGKLRCDAAQLSALDPTAVTATAASSASSSSASASAPAAARSHPFPLWLHMLTDGTLLYFLRRVDAASDRNQFTLTVFDPAQAVPPSTDEDSDSGSDSGIWILPRMLGEIVLPSGFTWNLPRRLRRQQSLKDLISPFHFFVGQKIDAKDSVNKWIPAVVVQTTASRILVHYEGWASKWDEWMSVDSVRIGRRGEYTAAAASKEDKASNGMSAGLTSTQSVWQFSQAKTEGSEASWTALSSLHSEKLESLFGTAASTAPCLLRTARREYAVHLSRLLMIDTATQDLYWLRRVSPPSPEMDSVHLEDVLLYTTGRQLVMCVPNAASAAGSRTSPQGQAQDEIATMRVFDLPDVRTLAQQPHHAAAVLEPLHPLDFATIGLPRTQQVVSLASSALVLATWAGDAALPTLSARSALTHTTVADAMHAQVSSLCFDATSNCIWSYEATEQRVFEFINQGPPTSSSHTTEDFAAALSSPYSAVVAASPSSASTSPLAVVSSVLAQLAHAASLVGASTSCSVPFAVEVSPQTFDALRNVLQTALSALSSDQPPLSATHLSSIVLHTLKLLEVNLSQLDEYERTASADHVTDVKNQMPALAAAIHAASNIVPSSSGASGSSLSASMLSAVKAAANETMMSALPYFYPTPASLAALLCSHLDSTVLSPPALSTASAAPNFIVHQQDPFIDSLLAPRLEAQLLAFFLPSSSPDDVAKLLLSALTSVYKQGMQITEGLLANWAVNSLPIRAAPTPNPELHPAITSPAPLLLSSTMRLLLRLQRHLFAVVDSHLGAASCSAEGQRWMETLSLYVARVYELSASLLQHAHDSCVVLGFSTLAQRTRQCLQEDLQSTLAGSLFPLVSTMLPALSLQPDLAASEEARSKLCNLASQELENATHALDRWNALCFSAGSESTLLSAPTATSVPVNLPAGPPASGSTRMQMSTSLLSTILTSNLEWRSIVVESPHPYLSETWDRNIEVPGAVALWIEVDPRSCSRNAQDLLKLTQTLPKWVTVCSGPARGSSSSSTAAGASSFLSGAPVFSTWPSQLLRRPGDRLDCFWSIDKKDADKAAEAAKLDPNELGNSWGFRIVVHAFVPHPAPRCIVSPNARAQVAQSMLRGEPLWKLTEQHASQRISWSTDLQHGVASMYGLLAKPLAVVPTGSGGAQKTSSIVVTGKPTHPLSPLACVFADSLGCFKTDSSSDDSALVLDESLIDSSLDMELVSMGSRADAATSADPLLSKEQVLLAELMEPDIAPSGFTSAPTSPLKPAATNAAMSSQTPSPPLPSAIGGSARLLVDWVCARLSGRPAMNASMKRAMMPCESRLLGTFLAHANLLTPAAELLALIQEDGAAGDLGTPLITPQGSPSLMAMTPPHRSPFLASSHSLPSLHSSPALAPSSSTVRRRAMSPAQSSLFNRIRPVWISVYKLEQSLLSAAQNYNKFHSFANEDSRLNSITEEELSTIQKAPVGALWFVPPQSVAMDEEMESDAVCSAFILLKLSSLSTDTLKTFCALCTPPCEWREDNPEFTLRNLTKVIRRMHVETEARMGPEDERPPPTTTVQGLDLLTSTTNDLANFLARFTPNTAWLAQIGEAALITKLSAFFSQALKNRVGINASTLALFVERRDRRVAQRIQAYSTLASALALMSVPSVRESLLSCVEAQYYASQVKGCTAASFSALKTHFGSFLRQILKAAPSSELSIPMTQSILSYASLPFDPMHDAQMLAGLPWIAFIAAVVRMASTAAKSCDESASDRGSACQLTFSGETYVAMDVFECFTCGLRDGSLCCRPCAMLCHVGHDIRFKHRGPSAFCDCGVTVQSGAPAVPASHLHVECHAMNTVHVARQKRKWELLAAEATTALHSFSMMCLRWDPATPHVAALHAKVLTELIQSIITQVKTVLWRSRTANEESFLHSLLLLAVRSRRSMVAQATRSAETVISASVVAAQADACVSDDTWFELVDILLQVLHYGSTRLQRHTCRLLRHLLPVLPMQRATREQFPSLALFPKYTPPTSSASTGSTNHVSGALVAALFYFSGDLVLRSTPQLLHMRAPNAAEPPSTTVPAITARSATRYQVKIFLSDITNVGEMDASASSTGAPGSALAEVATAATLSQVFLDRFSAHVLQMQTSQTARDARTENFLISSTSTLSDPPDEEKSHISAASLKLDASYSRELRTSLETRREACVFQGSESLCTVLAKKIAATGIVCAVEVCAPEVIAVRNNQLASAATDQFDGASSFNFGGKQCLMLCSDMVAMLRGMIQAGGAWSRVVQESMAALLGKLDESSIFPEAVQRAPTATSSAQGVLSHLSPAGSLIQDSFVASFGALQVLAGSGLDVPRFGGPIVLSSNSSGDSDALPADVVVTADGSRLPRVTLQSVTSPWRLGKVVCSDETTSEMLVVYDDDPRRAVSRTHCAKMHATSPMHTHETKWIRTISTEIAVASTKRVLHALSILRDFDQSTAPRDWLWFWSLLQVRLLRALCILVQQPGCASLLLSSAHVSTFQWVSRLALGPGNASDYRTVALDWAKAAETLIDLRWKARQLAFTNENSPSVAALDESSEEPAAHGPTGWSTSTAANCLLSDSARSLEYLGGPNPSSVYNVAAPRASASYLRRVKKTDIMPVTIVADAPFVRSSVHAELMANPVAYFEVRIEPNDSAASEEDLSELSVGFCPDSRVIHRRRLHGWSPSSFVLSIPSGQKGQFMSRARNPERERLSKGDLIDVKDNVGKWEPAVVLSVTKHDPSKPSTSTASRDEETNEGDDIHVHYVNWDQRYDETVFCRAPGTAWSGESRVAQFATHTRDYAPGQLFLENYAFDEASTNAARQVQADAQAINAQHDTANMISYLESILAGDFAAVPKHITAPTAAPAAGQIKAGDTVGCGWNLLDNSIFFTLNGKHLGTAFESRSNSSSSSGSSSGGGGSSPGPISIPSTLYPSVTFSKYGTRVTANFGCSDSGSEPVPFAFKDLEALKQQLREQHAQSVPPPRRPSEIPRVRSQQGQHEEMKDPQDMPAALTFPDGGDVSQEESVETIAALASSRREKALSILHIGILPDATVAQLETALRICDDDAERAVAYAFEHPEGFVAGGEAALPERVSTSTAARVSATGSSSSLHSLPPSNPFSSPMRPGFSVGDPPSSIRSTSPWERQQQSQQRAQQTRVHDPMNPFDSDSDSAEMPSIEVSRRRASLSDDDDDLAMIVREPAVHSVAESESVASYLREARLSARDSGPRAGPGQAWSMQRQWQEERRLAQSPVPRVMRLSTPIPDAMSIFDMPSAVPSRQNPPAEPEPPAPIQAALFQHSALDGPRTSNDYFVSEAQEIHAASMEAPSARRGAGLGGGSLLDGIDWLAVLSGGSAQGSRARQMERIQISELLDQLRFVDHNSVSNVLMLLADILPAAQNAARAAGGLGGGGGGMDAEPIMLIPMGGPDRGSSSSSSKPAPESRFRNDELAPGLRVRVSRDAKKMLTPVFGSHPHEQLTSWVPQMDGILEAVGTVALMDRVRDAALVEFVNVESSTKSVWWLPSSVLTRVYAVRSNASVGLQHEAVLQPHMRILHSKLLRHHACHFLLLMAPLLSELIRTAVSKAASSSGSSMVSLADPTAPVFLKHHFPSYCRDILLMSSQRNLEKIMHAGHYAHAVILGLNAPSVALRRSVTVRPDPLAHLLKYLVTQQPQQVLHSLQATFKLLAEQSRILQYSNSNLEAHEYKAGGKKDPALTQTAADGPHDVADFAESNATSSNADSTEHPLRRVRLPVLWSSAVSMPNAAALCVAFQGRVCLPSGCALQFYSNAQQSRLLYSFSGPKSVHATPTPIAPFTISASSIFVRLVLNPLHAMPPTQAHGSSALANAARYDNECWFKLHVSPISEQLTLATSMAEQLMTQFSAKPEPALPPPPPVAVPAVVPASISPPRTALEKLKLDNETVFLSAIPPPVSPPRPVTVSAAAPLSPSSSSLTPLSPLLVSSKSDREFLWPLLKQVFSEALDILCLNSKVAVPAAGAAAVSSTRGSAGPAQVQTPTILRIHMLRILSRLVLLAPRGGLGDLHAAVQVLEEMRVVYREEQRGYQRVHENDSASAVAEQSPALVLHSSLFQAMVELNVAIKTYGVLAAPSSAVGPTSPSRVVAASSPPMPIEVRSPRLGPAVPSFSISLHEESKCKGDAEGEEPDEFEALCASAPRLGAQRTAATLSPSPLEENPPPLIPDEDSPLHSDTEEPLSRDDDDASSLRLSPHPPPNPAAERKEDSENGVSNPSGSHSPSSRYRLSASASDPDSIVVSEDEGDRRFGTIPRPRRQQFAAEDPADQGGAQAERWGRLRDGLQVLEHQRAVAHRRARQRAEHWPDAPASLDEQLLSPLEQRSAASAIIASRSAPSSAPASLLHPSFAFPDYVCHIHVVATHLRALHEAAIADRTPTMAWALPVSHPAYVRAQIKPSTAAVQSLRDKSGPSFTTLWTLGAYEQLTHLLNELSNQLNVSPLSLLGSSIPALTDAFWRDAAPGTYHLLLRCCGGSHEKLTWHALQLQRLMALLLEHLGKMDLSMASLVGGGGTSSRTNAVWSGEPELSLDEFEVRPPSADDVASWSLVQLVERSHVLLCTQPKQTLFHQLIQETAVANASGNPGASAAPPTVRINRLQASEGYDRAVASSSALSLADRHADVLSRLSSTVFGQIYSQLRGVHCGAFRKPKPTGAAPHVAFQVMLDGESVLGLAGPYRILFSQVCEELMQPKSFTDPFPLGELFAPTPNALHQVGEQRGAVMPNPSATTLQHLELFEFCGRLIGIAIRTKVLMSLQLPSLFWTLLSGRAPTRADLRSCDQTLVDSILKSLDDCTTEEQFAAAFGYPSSGEDYELSAGSLDGGSLSGGGAAGSTLHFPVTRSDNSPAPGWSGPAQAVTFATAALYASQLETVRLYECAQQIHAIRRGLADILPLELLSLFSPSELAVLVCGHAEVDIPLLKAHTEYAAGLSAETPHVQWMWRVLEEFTNEQKRKFIKFTYAQERLPATAAAYAAYPKTRLLIKPSPMRAGVDPDHVLPHAETCFFNLQLPSYSSFEIMRERLITTIACADALMSGDDFHQNVEMPPPAVAAAASSAAAAAAAAASSSSASSSSSRMPPSPLAVSSRSPLASRQLAASFLNRASMAPGSPPLLSRPQQNLSSPARGAGADGSSSAASSLPMYSSFPPLSLDSLETPREVGGGAAPVRSVPVRRHVSSTVAATFSSPAPPSAGPANSWNRDDRSSGSNAAPALSFSELSSPRRFFRSGSRSPALLPSDIAVAITASTATNTAAAAAPGAAAARTAASASSSSAAASASAVGTFPAPSSFSFLSAYARGPDAFSRMSQIRDQQSQLQSQLRDQQRQLQRLQQEAAAAAAASATPSRPPPPPPSEPRAHDDDAL